LFGGNMHALCPGQKCGLRYELIMYNELKGLRKAVCQEAAIVK
jgi:hypothetical protein